MPDISPRFSLQPFHTFGLTAHARRLVTVRSEAELQEAVRQCRHAGERLHILGEGSNTVFVGDVADCVIRVGLMGREWLQPDADAWRLRVAAGENWHALVEWTLLQDRPGLENLALIPGSVGACPVQNIGAYGLEVMERIESVRVMFLDTLEFAELSAAECQFSYRDSVFKQALAGRVVITAVTFRLPRQWQAIASYADVARYLGQRSVASASPRDVFNAVVAVRTTKLPDPRVQGNAGSFFKNPIVAADCAARLQAQWPELVSYPQPDGRVKLAAGWLIDRAGLKGYAVGGAAVSDRQALVLLNRGRATAADLAGLVAHVQATVKTLFGVELEPEPVMVGAC